MKALLALVLAGCSCGAAGKHVPPDLSAVEPLDSSTPSGDLTASGDLIASGDGGTTIPTPGNVTATANASSITVSWSAVGGVAKYNVYRYPSQSGPYDKKYTVNAPTTLHLDASLLHGPWSYRVDAEDAGGLQSLPSAFVSAVAGRELCIVNSYRAQATIVPAAGVVVVPASSADSNPLPLRAITADKAPLYEPRAIAVDIPNNRVLVSNYRPPDAPTMYTTVQAFNRTDSSLAGSNVVPLKTFNVNHPTGITPGDLPRPTGIAWDAENGEVVVVNQGAPAVTAYKYSDTMVSWNLVGTNAILSGPQAVALRRTQSDTEIYVTNLSNGTVTVYSRAAIVVAAAADSNKNANLAPVRLITKYTDALSRLSINNPNGIHIFLPPPPINPSFFIANGAGSVAYFPLGSGSAPPTGTAVVPTGQIFSASFKTPSGLVIDIPGDTLYLLNSSLNVPNGFVTMMSVDGSSTRGTISGVMSSLNDPSDIAFCN